MSNTRLEAENSVKLSTAKDVSVPKNHQELPEIFGPVAKNAQVGSHPDAPYKGFDVETKSAPPIADATGVLANTYRAAGVSANESDATGVLANTFGAAGVAADRFVATGVLANAFGAAGLFGNSFDEAGVRSTSYRAAGVSGNAFDSPGVLANVFGAAGVSGNIFDAPDGHVFTGGAGKPGNDRYPQDETHGEKPPRDVVPPLHPSEEEIKTEAAIIDAFRKVTARVNADRVADWLDKGVDISQEPYKSQVQDYLKRAQAYLGPYTHGMTKQEFVNMVNDSLKRKGSERQIAERDLPDPENPKP